MSKEKVELHKLQRYISKGGIHHPLVAVDIENNTKTGDFICAAVYGERRRHKTHDGLLTINEYFNNRDELHEYLKTFPKWSCLFVFFNLSYDERYIYPILDTSKTLVSGTRYIESIVKETGVSCWDLCNHVDGSLEEWIDYLGMEEKWGIKKESMKNLKTRVISDAQATFRLGCFIEEFYYRECGVPMRATVAATALLLFRMKFFTDSWERRADIRMELEFDAYYGGRTDCFKKGEYDYFSYDVNSCYLSAMKDNIYPDMQGSVYIENGDIWRRYWDRGLQMILDCEVEVPECHIPFLPFRSTDKKKLLFSVGTFRGCWTSADLHYAIKIGLAKIIKVYRFIYYARSKPYFRGIADFIWQKRQEYKEQGNVGMDKMTKKLGNSLYGKFGQRKKDGALVMWRDMDGKKEFSGKSIEDFMIYWDWNEEAWIKLGNEDAPAKHCFPAISAFITSYARILLHKGMMANERALIYCDTDSIKTTEPAKGINISKELGDWGFEVKSRGIFYKPKWYEDLLDSEYTACKGVGRNAVKVKEKETEYSQTFEFERPDTKMESIRKKKPFGIWDTHEKELLYADDKRILLPGGETKPLRIVYGLVVREYSEDQVETQNEIMSLDYQINGIEEFLELSDLTQYLELVVKTGKNRGKIVSLTTRQFRKFLGYNPKTDMVRGKVRWEYCIDQLCARHNMGEEEFIRQIEELYRMKQELFGLRVERNVLSEGLRRGG